MRAMVLIQPGKPLQALELPRPRPARGQVLVEVNACAVCRTDLHVLEGELPAPKLPLVPGHEVVGRVVECGEGAERFPLGVRVGVPWLGWSCGACADCVSGRENLCDAARFTGYSIDGGYAEFLVADQRFCFPIPDYYSDAEAAPLLCAGMIGYRALLKAGEGKRLGIYGFGAAAHIVAQVARSQGRAVYAFTREGDHVAQEFARKLGAVWVGHSNQLPPEPLEAAIIFAPVGSLIPQALKAVAKGGTVVCGGIHMSVIPSFAYELLWGERTICSVANLTRHDGEEFMSLAPQVPVRTQIQTYPLAEANEVLERLRTGRLDRPAVLLPDTA